MNIRLNKDDVLVIKVNDTVYRIAEYNGASYINIDSGRDSVKHIRNGKVTELGNKVYLRVYDINP